ncbi:MAG: ABC transporter substrate-binding protein [Gracilibacteraceae bacterium]|jgi:peptide/nickel transport system substrate-binding protein|nr:ABC transporter substrate-binding protein [Gracilibacteraceae bacterium]
MKKTTRLLPLLFALLLPLFLAACTAPAASPGTPPAATADDKVVTYGLSASWEKLQPFNKTVSGWTGGLVVDKIFDSLVYVGGDGTVRPRNANEWSISPDGREISFRLNPGALWHDGEKVTARDWVFTLRTITDPDFIVADLGNFNILEGTADSGTEVGENSVGASAPDDYTFVVRLKNPTTLEDFLYKVPSLFRVLPEHLLKDIAPADLAAAPYWQAPVGSGPFRFVSEISGNTVELAANKDYYLGAPNFGKLVFKVMDISNFASALLAGEIDNFYTTISTDEAKALEGQAGVVVKRSGTPTGQMAVMLNNQVFTDKRVRLALNLALDKQLIIDQLYLGDAEATESYIIPTSKYYNRSLPTGRDLEKAKTLLAEAGWDPARVVTITAPAGIRQKVATIMQQNFADAGVKAEIQVVDTPTLYSGLTDGSVEMGLSGYSATLDPIYMSDLFTNRHTTFLHITDGRFTEYYEQIGVEQDEARRLQLVLEYQQLLYDEQPMINLIHSYKYFCHSDRLGNIVPEDTDYFNEAAWEWTVE